VTAGEIASAAERGEPVAAATVIAGPGLLGARRVIWNGRVLTHDPKFGPRRAGRSVSRCGR